MVKGNLGKFSKNYLDQNLWSYIDEKEIQGLILDEKFVQGRNFFFMNKISKDIMFMSRSLLDKSLDFDEKIWANLEDDDGEKKETYKSLFEGH